MASIYKTFLNNDVTSVRSLLHESVPITGSIVSGTYADLNIKNFSHGMWQAVYDYPYLSSSANHIFDITVAHNVNSFVSGTSTPQNKERINIYNQMAQILVGHDITGNILQFDRDGNFTNTDGDSAKGAKLNEIFVLNFARLLSKDEIKKGTFRLDMGSSSLWIDPFPLRKTIGDYGAQNDFRTNSPAGEYAILYSSSTGITTNTDDTRGVGLLYYQAGIAILSSSIFASHDLHAEDLMGMSSSQGDPISAMLTASDGAQATTSNINKLCDMFRHRFYNVSFNNTTELNSTIYFCRINHNEFNYSSNPTYLSGSKIRVKNSSIDEPVTYITGIALVSADNETLAVAKLSEPIKKSPQNELILRTRLDF